MNLVGKIFIVLIFIMSCLFMGFAVAIYASHTNWKTVVDAPETGLKAQLAKETEKSGQLQSERDRLVTERDTEELAKRKALSSLATEKQILEDKQREDNVKLTKLTQDSRDARATLAEAHKTLADMRQAIDGLRAEITKEQLEKDNAFGRSVELTDQLHDQALELKTLQDRNNDLAEDYGDAVAVLRKHDLKPIPELYAAEATKVDGLVMAVSNTGLIEVSIGEDDGLLAGHTLEVYRIGDRGTYLGKVSVTKLEPNKAACKILPEFRKGTIQKGDRVASKLH